VINRAFSGFYPNDICGVVYQNANRRLACQFTFACDGKSKLINERGAWARANRIAKQTLDGQIYVPEVAKSTHYHAVYVHPNWVGEMKKMVRYGIHNFYRPHAWGNGDDEPAWGSSVTANKKNSGASFRTSATARSRRPGGFVPGLACRQLSSGGPVPPWAGPRAGMSTIMSFSCSA
jgi:hypothetical protein